MLIANSAYAHSGRTNANGCHNDRKNGTGLHCHTRPKLPTTPTIPIPPPLPTPEPELTILPEANQNNAVLRGSVTELSSNYISQSADLSCVQTNKGAYNVRLLLTSSGFCVFSSTEVQLCTEYSSRFSFLTSILTIFNINVDGIRYQAGLEQNSQGCFSPFYSHNKEDIQQTDVVYDRAQWGGWLDEDGDCSDTRSEVLKSFNQAETNSDRTCILSVGSWLDPYSGENFTNPSELDIDHIVPLTFAHEHGAANWSPELKARFYNDTENLLAVSVTENRSKGGKSPEQWMPTNTSYHCIYVNSFLYIVDKYHLDLPSTERKNIGKQCSN